MGGRKPSVIVSKWVAVFTAFLHFIHTDTRHDGAGDAYWRRFFHRIFLIVSHHVGKQ